MQILGQIYHYDDIASRSKNWPKISVSQGPLSVAKRMMYLQESEEKFTIKIRNLKTKNPAYYSVTKSLN